MKLSSYIIYEKQYITLALYTLSCIALCLLKITISMFIGNKINARIYLLNSFVLDKIELSPTSIDKEFFLKNDLFVKLFCS
jgi:hypothetical protein